MSLSKRHVSCLPFTVGQITVTLTGHDVRIIFSLNLLRQLIPPNAEQYTRTLTHVHIRRYREN